MKVLIQQTAFYAELECVFDHEKLKADKIQRMLATIQFGLCCFPDSSLKKLKIKIYRTIILPVVLYGCETRYLTLREGHRLRVFGNRMLKRIFGG
jgi:hypothetical protein